ncbi:unnamed protein product [Rhizophagus irregularis]|nr:unnamed protein product [Rhizophagus irregularis]
MWVVCDVLEVRLDSTEVSILTAPIPLARYSNSSGDSKGVGPGNLFKADEMFFDDGPVPQSVKETNEEVASQSDKEDDDSDCSHNSDSEEAR